MHLDDRHVSVVTRSMCGSGIRGYSLALALACLAVSGAEAADIHWNGGFNDSWHQEFNWDFFGSPFSIRRVPADIDTATFNTPANDVVRLYGDTAPINGLTVQNRVDLLTNGFRLLVDNNGAANTLISGSALLRVESSTLSGPELHTDNLTVSNATLEITGGFAQIDGVTDIANGGVLEFPSGSGHVDFDGDVTVRGSGSIMSLRKNGQLFSYDFAPNSTISVRDGGLLNIFDEVSPVTINQGQQWRLENEGEVLVVGESLAVGPDSDGSLFIDGAGSRVAMVGLLEVPELQIGHETTGAGLVRLTNAGLFAPAGLTTIKATGALEIDGGNFNARGGVLVDGGRFSLAEEGEFSMQPSTNFTARNGAQVTIDKMILIEQDQFFTIESGADVTTATGLGSLIVGGLDADGEQVIDGAGTTLDLDTLSMGRPSPGVAVARLRNGAHAELGNLQISSAFSAENPTRGLLIMESGATAEVEAFFRIGAANAVAGSYGELVMGSGSSLTYVNPFNFTSSIGGSSSNGSGFMAIYEGSVFTSLNGAMFVQPTGSISIFGGLAPGEANFNGELILRGSVWLAAISGLPNDEGGILRVNAPITIDGGNLNLDEGWVVADSISFTGGGTFSFDGGTLSVGVFNGNLTVPSGGAVAPGESAGDTTVIGNYTQQGGSALEIEIGGPTMGTQHDFVNVSGTAVVDGLLDLSLINDFAPAATDSFIVFSAANLLGIFDNVGNGQRLATSDGLGSFLVHYGVGSAHNPNQIVLSSFESAFSADFDNDLDVDGADLAIWTGAFGLTAAGDADGDNDSDGNDFLIWHQQLGSPNGVPTAGAVPEPTSFAATGIVCMALAAAHRRRR